MKVLLVLWLIVGGQDIGGPPVEVPSMQECEARSLTIEPAVPIASFIFAAMS